MHASIELVQLRFGRRNAWERLCRTFCDILLGEFSGLTRGTSRGRLSCRCGRTCRDIWLDNLRGCCIGRLVIGFIRLNVMAGPPGSEHADPIISLSIRFCAKDVVHISPSIIRFASLVLSNEEGMAIHIACVRLFRLLLTTNLGTSDVNMTKMRPTLLLPDLSTHNTSGTMYSHFRSIPKKALAGHNTESAIHL